MTHRVRGSIYDDVCVNVQPGYGTQDIRIVFVSSLLPYPVDVILRVYSPDVLPALARDCFPE